MHSCGLKLDFTQQDEAKRTARMRNVAVAGQEKVRLPFIFLVANVGSEWSLQFL
jgi:hypothetical protein